MTENSAYPLEIFKDFFVLIELNEKDGSTFLSVKYDEKEAEIKKFTAEDIECRMKFLVEQMSKTLEEEDGLNDL